MYLFCLTPLTQSQFVVMLVCSHFAQNVKFTADADVFVLAVISQRMFMSKGIPFCLVEARGKFKGLRNIGGLLGTVHVCTTFHGNADGQRSFL